MRVQRGSAALLREVAVSICIAAAHPLGERRVSRHQIDQAVAVIIVGPAGSEIQRPGLQGPLRVVHAGIGEGAH